MDLEAAFSSLAAFSGADLGRTLARIENHLRDAAAETLDPLVRREGAEPDVLRAAGKVKQLAGQINVVIHALGVLRCLPRLLRPGENVLSVSLGAGNTGKEFDLETNTRIAEFKFITWRGGSETIRQNSVFKDFYKLAEADTPKSRYLYVLGTEMPLRFLNGKRALPSVLSRNTTLRDEFAAKYPEYHIVRDYYRPRREAVRIEDISPLVPEILGDEQV